MHSAPFLINGNSLWNTVVEAIEKGDLEGHLATLVLVTASRADGTVSLLSPWQEHVNSLLARDYSHLDPKTRSRDAALAGVRLALGDASGISGFADIAKREVMREPMHPAIRIYDDERLLLGIAAGIGVAAQSIASLLTARLDARSESVSIRAYCVDVWAIALSSGSPRLNESLAERAVQRLFSMSSLKAARSDDDRIGELWLATRLLDAASWMPDDAVITKLYDYVQSGYRAIQAALLRGTPFEVLDAAFALDALITVPAARLERRSARDRVLQLIEAFNACAAVLAHRQRQRPGILITDEYDVQDLFHSFAIPIFSDLVPEDPAAKVAGAGSRLDFTSRGTRIGIELKHVKSRRAVSKVRGEILIDERTYQAHPYIDTVIVFISDPNVHIPLHERIALENDLSQRVSIGGRTVEYIARIR